MSLKVFLLLSTLCAAAPGAAPVPVPVRGVAVEGGFPQGLPLIEVTGELLERYDISRERYLALPPEEKARLQGDLTLSEAGRLHKLRLIRRLAKQAWPRYVTAKGWLTPEGLRLIEEYERSLRASGLKVPVNVALERRDGKALTESDLARSQVILDRMFDGLAERGDLGKPGQELVWDAQFRNETLHHISVTNPVTGLSFEVGQLGVDGRTAVIAPSWYGSLTKRWESDPAAWVDYRVHAQIGYVDMRSRFFADSQKADPRLDRALELAGRLGVPQASLEQIRMNLDYDDAYKAQGLVVASLLTELGRAYNLFGPVDIAWTATNLTKIMHLAPNTAFDETVGLRVKLSDAGPYLGIFGGLTQNLSPVGNRLVQEALTTNTVAAGMNWEQAPHAALALWGRVPGLSDTAFKVSASQRWNRDTKVSEAEAAIMTTFLDRPLTLRGVVSREKGDAIEFDRRKLRAQLEYRVSENAEAYLAYEREKIRYGNADVDSDSFLAGFQMSFGGGRSTLRADQLWSHVRASSPLYPQLTDTLGRFNRDLAAGVTAAEKADQLYRRLLAGAAAGQLGPSLDALSQALGRLSPETLAQLLDELNRARLSSAQRDVLSSVLLRTMTATSPAYRSALAALSDALSRPARSSELAWLQTRALSTFESLAGRALTAQEQGRFYSYLENLRLAAENGPAADPALLQSLVGSLGLTQQQRQQLSGALGRYEGELRRILADPAAPASLPRELADASAYIQEHKGEILELAGLLSSPQVWDAVAVRAGRAAMLTGLAKSGKVVLPLLGHEMKLTIDAPVILAACNIFQSRLSPLAPVRKGDVEPWLLRMAGQSLGLDNPTEEAIVGRLFAMADAELRGSLTRALAPQIDALLAQQVYDRPKIAGAILGSLPAAAADALRRRFGADLAGLLPPAGSSPAQIREFLVTRLTGEVLGALHNEYGPELAKAVAAMTSWAGDVMRREINMTLIQLMLASEELNRLSVDHGRKAGDLSVQMAMSSFDKLDERAKRKASQRLRGAKESLAEETAFEEIRLSDKLTAYGKSRLESLTLAPGWPRGLQVKVEDEAWPTLLTSYGDSSLFAFVSRLAGVYKPKADGSPTLVEIDCERRASGTSISKGRDGVKYSLSTPRDFSEAVFKLSRLEQYLND
ncbi:MAG: hypothetical protein AAB320_06840 [Elusimicrobiota bacterium]